MAYLPRVIAPPLNGDPADFMSSITVLNKRGATYVVGTPSVTVVELDDLGYVLDAYGATMPSAGDAGYSVGARFRLTTANSGGSVFFNNGTIASALFQSAAALGSGASVAINATTTATSAQVAAGRITSTSAAPTTITLPTGTLLGAAIGAVAGTTMDLLIDNTAGANTVTVAVATNGILSAAAVANGASFGLLTIPSGVTGVGRFTLMFSSATAYVFTRTA
jgi:hypothetical protein